MKINIVRDDIFEVTLRKINYSLVRFRKLKLTQRYSIVLKNKSLGLHEEKRVVSVYSTQNTVNGREISIT